MLPWKRREVLLTQSTERLYKAEGTLRDAGITFEVKIVNNGSNSRTWLGRMGERAEFAAFYYIYVKKDDAERAQYVLRRHE